MSGFSGAVRILMVVVAVIAALAGKKKKTRDEENTAARTPAEPPLRALGEQRREQMARLDQWRAAKAQQDDARQMHAINMDSCESKLESLRVLYDAGILDREEYAQRVARVRSRHAHGTR